MSLFSGGGGGGKWTPLRFLVRAGAMEKGGGGGTNTHAADHNKQQHADTLPRQALTHTAPQHHLDAQGQVSHNNNNNNNNNNTNKAIHTPTPTHTPSTIRHVPPRQPPPLTRCRSA